MSGQKYEAIIHRESLEYFEDQHSPINELAHCVYSYREGTVKSPKIPVGSDAAKAYGEWMVEGVKSYLSENFGLNLNSLEFSGFEPSPNNPKAHGLKVSMDKGDLHLLDHFVTPDEIADAIAVDVNASDMNGFYQDCPKKVQEWRMKTPEMRSPEERGLLLNAATEFSWHTSLDMNQMESRLMKVKTPPELLEKSVSNDRRNEDLSVVSP